MQEYYIITAEFPQVFILLWSGRNFTLHRKHLRRALLLQKFCLSFRVNLEPLII